MTVSSQITNLRLPNESLRPSGNGGHVAANGVGVGKQLVHGWFEQQASSCATRVAAIFEGEELTYEALNQRANRVAHLLLEMGAGPETLIGLCVERSLDLLVGILGILKAGAAYVPVDPHYPRERMAFMLSDAQVKILLTQQQFLVHLPETGAAMVCLDGDHEAIQRQSTENPAHRVLPENPAYVIYTSGSTGTPKGVVVTHSNVVRLFQQTRHWFNFSSQDVWTLFHSYSFDFSVWEMWGPLFHGGKLVIVPYFVSRAPEELYRLLASERVTVLNQTPSAFRQLVKVEDDSARRSNLSLRLVIFGGEALELESLQPWIERHGDECPQLVNMFGITETTVHVTYRRILLEDLEARRGSVIGKGIPDLQIHACDAALQSLSTEEAGELYVGGDGLARGYLHQPELTAERFIPDPFSREPGARLYRTGDLARATENDLEYLGRMDQQVKVRGFRIELGEIESVLARHSGVRDCTVAAYQDDEGQQRLVAYLVPAQPALAKEEVYSFLQASLPDHMLPAAILFIPELPLTAHGKLDRKSLPLPEGAVSGGIQAAPSTETEKILAEVWRESLGLSSVGIDDNYFALGGDSIRSIKVRAKALEGGLKFSLQQLFQNPTVRSLAAHLGPQKSAGQSEVQPRPFVIAEEDRRKLPPDAEDAYPISPLQSGMEFHSQFSPDYIVYVSSVRLRVAFDAEKMQRALEQVSRRHEMLRTSFDLKTYSVPLQIVHRAAPPELTIDDLRHLSSARQQREIDEWLKNQARRRFDWSTAPLFRFHVHLCSEGGIQFTMSEPFLDGWSVASLLTEIFDRYVALLQSEDIPSPPLSGSYKDFVELEQEALRSTHCRDYWAKILSGSTATHLPWRKPVAAAERQEVVRLSVAIAAETAYGLKEVARQAEVSLKSLLLAAHMKVVSTLSGNAEVFSGLLINGRPETKDGEKLIGAFLNTIPFRMRLGTETWIELAKVAQAAENDALPYRRFPIQELQRLFHAEEKFDTIFNYTHFHVLDRLQAVPGLTVMEMKGSEQTYFPLTAQFSINELSSRVELALDYRTLELEEQQAGEIAGYYARVLQAMAAAPSSRHDSLCLLSGEQQQRLIAELNATEAAFSGNLCLHELFAAQAERSPDEIAVALGEERLTYRDLERRANQLARYLGKAEAGPETLVGVCLERSPQMIVALLGILKAGAGYLPLDPDYPDERLAFMLRDARIKVVVTQDRLLHRVPAPEIRRVCLDSDSREIALESPAPVLSPAQPGDLAYVIYTSGSTGQPKGVLIEHRGVVNTIQASIKKFGVNGRSRVVQLASLNFDASVLEIFTAVLSGATLYLVNRDVLLSGQELGHFVEQNSITTMFIPPSLLDLVPVGQYSALNAIVVGGEACSAETAARWSRGRQLFNAYAPTEATIYVTAMLCAPGERQAPPIGRPIQNMQVYLLDEFFQPVTVGVAGELHIGGVGVARGYLRRPALTAEKFVPNPFSREPGARLYKTGDLARFLPDGNIQFLGRTDQQVKVRGFRIELGEIEAALGSHPNVREVAVVAREDAPGERRIVAYVVPHSGDLPTTSDLRSHLKTCLPDYMLPAVFVMLDSMPLSETGKLDRSALPVPERLRPELAEGYLAPRTPLEKVLARIFAETLKIEQVGILDSFFELGGHSLIATQVISRIRELLAIDLPLRTLFEEPTVSALAGAILVTTNHLSDIERTTDIKRIAPGRQSCPVPLSFAQQRLWFLQQLDPASHLYNIPVAIRIEGPLNIPALEHAINEIIRRHESLRTVFKPVDGVPQQFVNAPFTVELSPIALQRDGAAEAETKIAEHAAAEARHIFDLGAGPLFRARLLRVSESEHVLLLCMHHIVSDGWSISVLLRELCALYLDGLRLPDLSIQYSDFCFWQRDAEHRARLAAQLAWWKDELAGLPPALALPTDRPRSSRRSFRGSAVPFLISRDLHARLAQVGQAEGATLFMTLLTAFGVLLFRYSGEKDFAVGTPVAGRTRLEIEPLIGFFVNTLPLRLRLNGQSTFRQLLLGSRDTCFAAYARQDAPFEMLVEELNPERDLGHSPLFQVMLDLQNAPVSPMSCDGLQLSLLPVETGTAKFDLTLTLSETVHGLEAALEYSTELFEDATASRIVENFRVLLESIAANPDGFAGSLALLSEAERRTLLTDWQGVRSDYNSQEFARRLFGQQALFEQQAQKNPQSIAVACGAASLTYRELDEKSNQLAQYLLDSGVSPGMLAGICLQRSIGMVVAIIAALKAGAAYVPLDPAYPPERLAAIIISSGAQLVITESGFLQQLPRTSAHVVSLDSETESIGAKTSAAPVISFCPADRAYVIFTSGSTGVPKGVVVSHANLAHSTQARMAYYHEPVEAFLLLPSFSFDSSVAGLFWTLCRGGKLVIPEEGSHHDPEHLAELIQRHHVSHVLCLPSLYRLLLEQQNGKLDSLRVAIVAGESAPADLLQLHRERLPQCRLFNEYGPTEATVWSTVFECSAGHNGNSVPIGRPISNTRIYLLDPTLELVPIGAIAELCIGGAGVAQGYLNAPEVTAERFIPDPFSEPPGSPARAVFGFARDKVAVPGSGLYKTGDLARYTPDGNLEFFGRNDLQVKIRGHRIELGELEFVLAQHPSVQQAAVTMNGGRLIAHVVLRGPGSAIANDLRGYLSSRLPNYMMPAAFVFAESLPCTITGKVDRNALKLVDAGKVEQPGDYVAPRTALEQVLTEIFAAVLDRERHGVRDNFFEAGGHSLMATQLVTRIREALLIELPLRRIFEQPTVEGMAAAILSESLEAKRVERTAELLVHFSSVSEEQAATLMQETTGDEP